jgi:hypothetical protein
MVAVGLALLAVLVLSGLLQPAPAQAALRVQAQLRLPAIDVIVHGGPRHAAPAIRNARIPQRLSKMDLKIAKRIAWHTPYRKAVLLNLRRAGYTWAQIGRMLSIPPRVMRVALASPRLRPIACLR